MGKGIEYDTQVMTANHNLMCAIDTETTSLDVETAEIIQLSIIPLDANYEISRKRKLLDLYIRPKFLSRVDPKALTVTNKKYYDILEGGLEQEAAIELIEKYINSLDLPEFKMIIPLGFNYCSFDKYILERMLGKTYYKDKFHGHSRDAMQAAILVNDIADARVEKIPFPKLKLEAVARQLGIEIIEHKLHDAMYDAYLAAQVYKKLTHHYLMETIHDLIKVRNPEEDTRQNDNPVRLSGIKAWPEQL